MKKPMGGKEKFGENTGQNGTQKGRKGQKTDRKYPVQSCETCACEMGSRVYSNIMDIRGN